MRISDLDDYHLSASALNPFAKCESKWFERYVLQSPRTAPMYMGYFTLGSRVHTIEHKFVAKCTVFSEYLVIPADKYKEQFK